jgi:hypothetical protein
MYFAMMHNNKAGTRRKLVSFAQTERVPSPEYITRAIIELFKIFVCNNLRNIK